jgi:hypothetical protein
MQKPGVLAILIGAHHIFLMLMSQNQVNDVAILQLFGDK